MSMLRKKVDGYYLIERIGAGRTSEMFLGINPKTREKLAFKVFGKCESLTPLAHARFAREVDVIRSLSHPGIIRIMTQGIVEENCYYAMEYMPGGHFGQMLQRVRRNSREFEAFQRSFQ
jgi:serine/threonine protein kinase